MPRGDADKVHWYVGGLIRKARRAGETHINIRVRDVRDDIGAHDSNAAMDICEVLETLKFRNNTRAVIVNKTGPKQGLDTVYSFQLF